MGYDVEQHGRYDEIIESVPINSVHKERIGKKYQWIAMYELAALVADNFKINIHTDSQGNKEEMFCQTSAEPNLRNIDPTTRYNYKEQKLRIDIHEKIYEISNEENTIWLNKMNDLPSGKDLLSVKHDGEDFILISGQFKWQEENIIGEEKYNVPTKDAWSMVNGYIIESENINQLTDFFAGKDFMGRWLAKPRSRYGLYNREFYWSDTYKLFDNSYYGESGWVYLYERETDIKVLLPSEICINEFDDYINDSGSSMSFYKPCKEMFKYFNLNYGEENTAMYDENGQLFCFDSKEVLNEDIGLYINKSMLNEFLKENKYKLAWTVLSEKRIIGNRYGESLPQPSISKVYLYDNGDIKEVSVLEQKDLK